MKVSGLDNFLETEFFEIKDKLAISTSSLIEGKWKCFSEFRKSKNRELLERSNIAIVNFYNEEQIKILDPWRSQNILQYADDVFIAGHSDYMDCLLLGLSTDNDYIFVTEDEGIRSFISKNKEFQKLKLLTFNQFMNKMESQKNQ